MPTSLLNCWADKCPCNGAEDMSGEVRGGLWNCVPPSSLGAFWFSCLLHGRISSNCPLDTQENLLRLSDILFLRELRGAKNACVLITY